MNMNYGNMISMIVPTVVIVGSIAYYTYRKWFRIDINHKDGKYPKVNEHKLHELIGKNFHSNGQKGEGIVVGIIDAPVITPTYRFKSKENEKWNKHVEEFKKGLNSKKYWTYQEDDDGNIIQEPNETTFKYLVENKKEYVVDGQTYDNIGGLLHGTKVFHIIRKIVPKANFIFFPVKEEDFEGSSEVYVRYYNKKEFDGLNDEERAVYLKNREADDFILRELRHVIKMHDQFHDQNEIKIQIKPPNVVNLSIGTSRDYSDSYGDPYEILDYYYYEELKKRGILLIIAAGNEGHISDNVITKKFNGLLEDRNGKMRYSKLEEGDDTERNTWVTGSTSCHVTQVELGKYNIGLSKFNCTNKSNDVCSFGEAVSSYNNTGEEVWINGTSFSSPVVTGTLALILSQIYKNKSKGEEYTDKERESFAKLAKDYLYSKCVVKYNEDGYKIKDVHIKSHMRPYDVDKDKDDKEFQLSSFNYTSIKDTLSKLFWSNYQRMVKQFEDSMEDNTENDKLKLCNIVFEFPETFIKASNQDAEDSLIYNTKLLFLVNDYKYLYLTEDERNSNLTNVQKFKIIFERMQKEFLAFSIGHGVINLEIPYPPKGKIEPSVKPNLICGYQFNPKTGKGEKVYEDFNGNLTIEEIEEE